MLATPPGRATGCPRPACDSNHTSRSRHATSQTLPDGRTIGFGYDANGNPTSLTPPGRPAHSFSYSLVDQATGYDPPGSPPASYSYDLDRRLIGINFASGGTVNLSHDTENRLLSVDTNDDDLTLTYVPGTTHVAGISRSNGQSNAYTYDGFLPLSQSWSGVVSGNVSFDYDADFRIDSLTVNGTPIAYGYDGDSLLTEAGALTASRDPANGLLTGTSLDTISTSWSYNGFGEPVAYEATDGANTLFREEMDRDLLGRITQKRETFGTTTTVFDYGYDETGRLVWVDIDSSRAVTWTYDSNDNRLTEVTSSGTTSGTYDDQDRLLSYGSSTYAWDDDGDLVTRTTNSFVETFDYDVFGNLVTYSSPSIDIEYVIDGQNRRVGKRINGTLIQGFLYADQLNPVAELDGSGNVLSTFIYGTRPNTPDYMLKDGVTYRIISDHLGSVRLVVNAVDGTIAQRMDDDAWGNTTFDSNPGFQPFGFAGGIYDRHTGLTRFGARDYDPQTGRWTAKDPILFAGGDTNLYRYAAGDPVNYVDPNGYIEIPADEQATRDFIDKMNEIADEGGGAIGLDELLAPLGVPATPELEDRGPVEFTFPDPENPGDGTFVCTGEPFTLPLDDAPFDLRVKKTVEGDVTVGDDFIEIDNLKGIKVRLDYLPIPKAVKGLEVVPGLVKADL